MQPQYIAPAFLVLGLGLYWCSVYIPLLHRGLQSERWPTTAGLILGASLTDADRTHDIRSYALSVSFQYTVAGVSYTSPTLSFRYALPFFSATALYRAKAPYPPGSTVQVWYNPDDPASAVLKPGAGWENAFTVSVSLLVLLFGVVLAKAAL